MARRALSPAGLALVGAVERALLPTDRQLVVGCSGGADSLALAFAVRVVAARHALGCAAVVVDHRLQPESAVVAGRARQRLVDLGFRDVAVAVVAVSPTGDGPEAAARAARYAALQAAAVERDASVWLGHTLDDQAETVLLGLARGSGVRSLAGMAPRSGRLVRPLLGLSRATTAQCCAELGLEPWRDPQNADPRFARVRVRERVLPRLEAELGPGVATALARTAQLARADADLLDELARAAYAEVGRDGELPCLDVAALPPALRRRVLKCWLTDAGATDLSAGHVTAVEGLVLHWHGQGRLDLPGVGVRRVDDRLCADKVCT